jgi:hypothetical protein
MICTQQILQILHDQLAMPAFLELVRVLLEEKALDDQNVDFFLGKVSSDVLTQIILDLLLIAEPFMEKIVIITKLVAVLVVIIVVELVIGLVTILKTVFLPQIKPIIILIIIVLTMPISELPQLLLQLLILPMLPLKP